MRPSSTHTDAAHRSETAQKHYQHLAEKYDDFLYYSTDFVRSLTSKMIEKLRLQPADRLVDLGCGTGMYSIDILRQVPLSGPVIGVDPIPEMLARIPGGAPITPVEMDALTFSAQEGTYDKILMKEAVHHVDDRALLFSNLFRRLAPNGRLLLVHVPPMLAYPLFEKALLRARQWHADPGELARLLAEAGFEVEADALEYRHSIPKAKYFQMVESQYMSVLFSFSGEEIREGLAEMERQYHDVATLTFVDHFDYITALRTA